MEGFTNIQILRQDRHPLGKMPSYAGVLADLSNPGRMPVPELCSSVKHWKFEEGCDRQNKIIFKRSTKINKLRSALS